MKLGDHRHQDDRAAHDGGHSGPLMNSDPDPYRPEHDLHFTGGRFTRVELDDGLACRFFGEKFRCLLGLEKIHAHSPAAAGSASR